MMKPCINQVTTLSTPFEVDIGAYAYAGWTAVEVWLTKLETYLETHSIAEARGLLATEGIQAVGASSQGGLLLSTGAERAAHWEDFERRLQILGELSVPLLVVAADFVAEPVKEDYSRA
ncbi:MAG TPA: sugar phosphate isomerase/epimerase, partial [Isosphaeraceae bacterium]|nr:sugar phosphate isomerase/epimerase [Isosphaeraceae bacterium]